MPTLIPALDIHGCSLYIPDRFYNLRVISVISIDPLDQTFHALSDPTRRAILARLANGEATVLELAEPFAMSQPAISKHLKVLERAGLISRSRDAQRRPCRLEGAPLGNISEWLEGYRTFWEASYDRLDALLEEMKAERRTKRTSKKSTRKRSRR